MTRCEWRAIGTNPRTVPGVSALWNELSRPWVNWGLLIVALGTLDLVYALAPKWSQRYRLLRVVFWALYPVLLLTFFSGRRARQDRETHQLYAWFVVIAGILVLAAALL